MVVGGLTIKVGGFATVAGVTFVVAPKHNRDWMRFLDLNFKFELGLFELPTPELLSDNAFLTPWLL